MGKSARLCFVGVNGESNFLVLQLYDFTHRLHILEEYTNILPVIMTTLSSAYAFQPL